MRYDGTILHIQSINGINYMPAKFGTQTTNNDCTTPKTVFVAKFMSQNSTILRLCSNVWQIYNDFISPNIFCKIIQLICIPAWPQISGTPFTEMQVQCACEQRCQMHLTLAKVHNDFSPVCNQVIVLLYVSKSRYYVVCTSHTL